MRSCRTCAPTPSVPGLVWNLPISLRYWLALQDVVRLVTGLAAVNWPPRGSPTLHLCPNEGGRACSRAVRSHCCRCVGHSTVLYAAGRVAMGPVLQCRAGSSLGGESAM